MQRTDPPAASIVGTAAARIRHDRSITRRCDELSCAAARADIASTLSPTP